MYMQVVSCVFFVIAIVLFTIICVFYRQESPIMFINFDRVSLITSPLICSCNINFCFQSLGIYVEENAS